MDTLTFPGSLKKIADYAFQNTNLSNIIFPESSSLTEIGTSAFFDSGLRMDTLTFPGSLKRIDHWAFQKTNLKRVIFPESIERIGCSAFANIPNLMYCFKGKGFPKSYCHSAFGMNDNNVTRFTDCESS